MITETSKRRNSGSKAQELCRAFKVRSGPGISRYHCSFNHYSIIYNEVVGSNIGTRVTSRVESIRGDVKEVKSWCQLTFNSRLTNAITIPYTTLVASGDFAVDVTVKEM